MAEFNPRNNGDVNAAFALLELFSVPSVAPSSRPGSRSPSSWSSSEESGSNASHTTHSHHHHHHHHHHEANHQHCHHHEQYDHKQQAVLCRADGCVRLPIGGLQFCRDHAGPRHCQFPSCTKCAYFNTPFCEAHGSNGKRCVYPGCNKSARDKDMCSTHGGVKRCIFNGCSKLAMTGSIACGHHGGGRRCQFYNCSRSAQSSTFCVRHGGGRKCHIKGCQKITRGCDDFCTGHGGGIRCRVEGCRKAAIGKLRMCRGHAGLPKKRSSVRAMKDQTEQSKMMMGVMTEGVGVAVAAVAFQQPESFQMRSQEVDNQPVVSMDAANFNVELSATTSIPPPAAAMWQASPPSSTTNDMATSFVSGHASKPTALPFLPACGISMKTAVTAAVAAANTMDVSSSLVASVSFRRSRSWGRNIDD